MKQALILCGGEARRLRPYSYSVPKSCMPFLNLPLLSFSWFYLEQLGISHFLLNSHLFPEKLENTVKFLSKPQQNPQIFFEKESLGSAGTLFKLKSHLRKKKEFFYLNGDSLFFPSHKDSLSLFEDSFLKSDLDASFFVSPLSKNFTQDALWCDKDWNLKFIGKKVDRSKKAQETFPCYFSGLALFKSSLLKYLDFKSSHLFLDFINPLLSKKKIKVFVDKEAQILEMGEKQSYIKSLSFCLKILFEKETQKKNQFIKKTLQQGFSRFDPQDQIVGFHNGKKWSKKLGFPLLAPKSVRGLNQLKLKGPAVLGHEVNCFGQSLLNHCVLGPKLSWKGKLDREILLKTTLK